MISVPPPAQDAQPPTLTETERLRIRMAALILLNELGEDDAAGVATALSHWIAPTVAAIISERAALANGNGDA